MLYYMLRIRRRTVFISNGPLLLRNWTNHFSPLRMASGGCLMQRRSGKAMYDGNDLGKRVGSRSPLWSVVGGLVYGRRSQWLMTGAIDRHKITMLTKKKRRKQPQAKDL